MKLLLVAREEELPTLAPHFATDFEVIPASDAGVALEHLRQQPMDALVVHLGIGESDALDLLYGARKLTAPPGMVVVAEACELRLAVEVMRAGAYDVQLVSSLSPGRLAHSVRNATLLTTLTRRRSDPAK